MAVLSTITLAHILMPCVHDKTFTAETYLEGIVPKIHICCSVALWHQNIRQCTSTSILAYILATRLHDNMWILGTITSS